MEQVLLNLTDRDRSFNNPFQLATHVQEILLKQAEQAGGRAVSWKLEDFDKVGGANTLRMVWNELKSESRVLGKKRSLEEEDESVQSAEKKLCASLDMSGTCGRLRGMGLSSDSSDCQNLRNDSTSSSESEVDVSLLLENTRATSEPDRLMDEALNIIEPLREEVPGLVSTESSAVEDYSDSGNSECQWGGNGLSQVRGSYAMGPSGEVVPVVVGNDSLSDSSAEVRRVVSQMRLLTESSDSFESDGYGSSDVNNDASSESESSSLSNNEQVLLFADDAQITNENAYTSDEHSSRDLTSGSPSSSEGSGVVEQHSMDEMNACAEGFLEGNAGGVDAYLNSELGIDEHLLESSECGNDKISNADNRVGVSNRICPGGGTEQIWSLSHVSIVQQRLTEMPRDIADDTNGGGSNKKELEVVPKVFVEVKDNEQSTD